MRILTHAETLQTSLIESAVLVRGAGRLADTVTALQRVGAVQGAVAGAGDPHTLHLGVTSEVLGADTLLPVALSTAQGIETTGSLGTAEVSTPAILTDLARLTVCISGAGTWRKYQYYNQGLLISQHKVLPSLDLTQMGKIVF